MASRSVNKPVISRAFASTLLAGIEPGSIETPMIAAPKLAILGTNILALNPDLVKAELDEQQVAFTGYLAGGSAVTLTTPGVVRHSASMQLLAGNVVWVLETGDPQITGVGYGAYLYDTTYGLIASGYFDAPVSLGSVGDYLDLLFGVPVFLLS